MNQVILIGNLVSDPSTSVSASGINVAKFRLAVNGKTDSEFFNIVAFNGTAELAGKYLTKGRKIAITGHLHNSRWETEDGQKRVRLDIVADQIEFLTSSAKPNNKAEVEIEEDEEFE